MSAPDASAATQPPSVRKRRERRAGGPRRRLTAKAVALWVVIVALGILFGIIAVAIALQAPNFSLMQWLVAIGFLLPLGAALVALIWYGRIVGSATEARDVAEAAARSSEEGFRTVAATMGDGIITIDDRSRIQYVNQAAERLFGYTREELLGSELTMLMPESFHERHRKGIGRYLSTGTRHVSWEGIAFTGRHKDGTERPLEISIGEHTAGDRHLFTGIVRDVTERRRSEQALAQSEAKFRGLIMSAPDGIFVIDPEATILDVNPAGETLIGRPRGEILGRNLTEFIPSERADSAREYIADRPAGLRASELYEGTWIAGSGRRIKVQLTSQVVRPDDADPYLVVLVRDVSEQHEMQRKLLESERWASMGRLASFVAHEINTPLTNISLLTASVSRRITDPEIQERLRKISAQGKIAANITSELLRFARPGAINPAENDLAELVRGAVEQAEAFRKPGTELRTELDEGPVLCHVDALRIQEVVVNLLKNAYDATPTGSVTVRLKQRGDSVAIAVADTGMGIPPEVQARLFEAFFTTKKKGEGTGLGLAISRNFVVSHGGDITVASEVNKGSTFTVVLPKRAPVGSEA